MYVTVREFSAKVNHISLLMLGYFALSLARDAELIGWTGNPSAISMSVRPPPTPQSSILIAIGLYRSASCLMVCAESVSRVWFQLTKSIIVPPLFTATAVLSAPSRATSTPKVMPPSGMMVVSADCNCCHDMMRLSTLSVGLPSQMCANLATP